MYGVDSAIVFVKRHSCFLICLLLGCFAGIFGIVCGSLVGVIIETIFHYLMEERRLKIFLESGKLEAVPGEKFPGAFYVSALLTVCLKEFDEAVFQLHSIFGAGEWATYCRIAFSCKNLNSDLLTECVASVIKKEMKSAKAGKINPFTRKIPVQDIFRLLTSAEFLWDDEKNGKRPSKYLAELLNYQFEKDELSAAYRVLGLNPGESLEKVRRAHRKLAAKYHPDSKNGATPESLSSFVRIQTAYETIVHQLS